MHKEIGKCNSKELYAIIEKSNPEIIFEEFDLSRTDDEYYKNGHYKTQSVCSLETITIMKYLENHQIIHKPVDTYDVTYFPEDMYAKISNVSEEYNNLVKMNFIFSCQQGLLYLNSVECSDLLEKIHLIEEEVVKKLNDKILLDSYKSWQLITTNRENEMIKNIYDYSKSNGYNNAIFITGAEHKRSIIEKIRDYERKNEIKINWNYNL
jgi:uncharacterized protein YktA (UPF0223 family)